MRASKTILSRTLPKNHDARHLYARSLVPKLTDTRQWDNPQATLHQPVISDYILTTVVDMSPTKPSSRVPRLIFSVWSFYSSILHNFSVISELVMLRWGFKWCVFLKMYVRKFLFFCLPFLKHVRVVIYRIVDANKRPKIRPEYTPMTWLILWLLH